MRRSVQFAIFVLCVVFSVAAVYNVYADNAEVEAMAGAVACAAGDAARPASSRPRAGASCAPRVTQNERTPFGQTFEFAVASRTIGVSCRRAWVIVGEYACAAM